MSGRGTPRGRGEDDEEEEISELRGASSEKRESKRRFTTHVFRKTPTAGHGHALCWGFMDKQVRLPGAGP